MKIMSVPTATPAQSMPAAPHRTAPGSRHAMPPAAGRATGGPSPPGRNKSCTGKEHSQARLIHPRSSRHAVRVSLARVRPASSVRSVSRDATGPPGQAAHFWSAASALPFGAPTVRTSLRSHDSPTVPAPCYSPHR
jgi:hypothetical protein